MKVHEQHKHKAPKNINIALIVVSTSRYEEQSLGKKTTDETVPLVKDLLKRDSAVSLSFMEIIPDSKEHINSTLFKLRENGTVDAIIFSGGTGLSRKDLTYETIEPQLEKKIDGFGELFRFLSYNEIGPSAMLSRAEAGIYSFPKKKVVIFLLPGSPDAVKLALNTLIIPEIGHILYIINKPE